MPLVIASLRTGTTPTASLRTLPPLNLVKTGGASTASLRVPPPLNLVKTGGVATASLRVPQNFDGLLQLKPLIAGISEDCSTLVVEDNTGVYNGTTNTWGYAPEDAPIDPNRPRRSEVDLYIGILTYMPTGQPVWVFSQEQDPELNPYTITIAGPPSGVNEVHLVAVPRGTVLTDLQEQYLYAYALQEEGWYYGSAPGIGLYCPQEAQMIALLKRYNDATLAGECEFLPYVNALALQKSLESNLQAFRFNAALEIYAVWVEYLNRVSDPTLKCNC